MWVSGRMLQYRILISELGWQRKEPSAGYNRLRWVKASKAIWRAFLANSVSFQSRKMDPGENSVEINPHGLARQPAKRRFLRKARVHQVSSEPETQVRRLDGHLEDQQQQQQKGEKLKGSLVDELRLHFDFESLKEGWSRVAQLQQASATK